MRALIIFACLTTLCGTAVAQQRVSAPHNPITDIRDAIEGAAPRGGQNALQQFAKILTSDFQGAEDMAVSVPGMPDGNGQACWREMKSAGKILQSHPIPQGAELATDIETIRLLFMVANKVCTNSACTQVFADGANVVQALGPIPVLSLNGICSKIPQIAAAPALPPDPSSTASAK